MGKLTLLAAGLTALLLAAGGPAGAAEEEIAVEDIVQRVMELFADDFHSDAPQGSIGKLVGPTSGTPWARPKRYLVLPKSEEATKQAVTAWFNELSQLTGQGILPADDYVNILVIDAAGFKEASPEIRALLETAELSPEYLLQEARKYREKGTSGSCSLSRSSKSGSGITFGKKGFTITPEALARSRRSHVVDHAVFWVNSDQVSVQDYIEKIQHRFLFCLYPHVMTKRIKKSALLGILGRGATGITCLDELALRTFNDPRFIRSYVFDTLEREIRKIARDVIVEKSEHSVHCQDTSLAVGRET